MQFLTYDVLSNLYTEQGSMTSLQCALHNKRLRTKTYAAVRVHKRSMNLKMGAQFGPSGAGINAMIPNEPIERRANAMHAGKLV